MSQGSSTALMSKRETLVGGGPPLGAALERVAPLPPRRAARLAALAVAHQEGVVLHHAPPRQLRRRFLASLLVRGTTSSSSYGRRRRRLLQLLLRCWLFFFLLLLGRLLLLLLGIRWLGVGLLGIQQHGLHVLQGLADLGPRGRGELVALELFQERERHDGLLLFLVVIGFFFLLFVVIFLVAGFVLGDEPGLLDGADVEEGDAGGRRAVGVGHSDVRAGLGAPAPHSLA